MDTSRAMQDTFSGSFFGSFFGFDKPLPQPKSPGDKYKYEEDSDTETEERDQVPDLLSSDLKSHDMRSSIGSNRLRFSDDKSDSLRDSKEAEESNRESQNTSEAPGEKSFLQGLSESFFGRDISKSTLSQSFMDITSSKHMNMFDDELYYE